MGLTKSYKDLNIWSKGIDIVLATYQLIKLLPEHEKYSLANQLRKSAISVPSNIAEGWGRGSNNYFVQFLRISKGSLMELETQIFICYKLNYIEKSLMEDVSILIKDEEKMINSFIKSLSKEKPELKNI